MKTRHTRRFSGKQGQAAIIVSVFLVALLGIAGLAVDAGYAYVEQRHVQNMADSAATAGALVLLNQTSPTDTQVYNAMQHVLQGAGANPVWQTTGGGPPSGSPTGRITLQAEYEYYDSTTGTSYPSSVYVGSLGNAQPPQVHGNQPNAIKIDWVNESTPGFFSSVLGSRTFTVQAKGGESMRPSSYNIMTSTVPGPSPICNSVSVPFPSELTPAQGFYQVITSAATGNITATWVITVYNNSGAEYTGLYTGTPFGPGSGTSTADPTTATTLTTPTRLDLVTVNGNSAPPLNYTADIGGQLPAGTYTLYFFNGSTSNGNGHHDYVGQGQINFVRAECLAPPTSPCPNCPPGVFVPFSIWAGNTISNTANGPVKGITMGETYNFWGQTWDGQVTGGSYDTTARFKGWINCLPPNCSTTNTVTSTAQLADSNPCTSADIASKNRADCWRTSTGNSSSPPGSPGYTGPSVLDANGCLPQYIDVLLLDNVGKVGGNDYGSIAGIVEIMVNQPCSYKPDPGHAMYGTVVGVIYNPENLVQGLPSGIGQIGG
jgi:hypothetical protein